MSTNKFPEAKQSEFTLISMLLRHKNNIETAIAYGLDIDCFYGKETRAIFNSILKLYQRKAFVDEFTVIDDVVLTIPTISIEQLKEITSKKVEHSDNLIGYIDQLKELKNQRKLIELLKSFEEIALTDKTADEKKELMSNVLSTVTEAKEDSRNHNEYDAFDGFLERIQKNIDNKGKNIIKTGFSNYDGQVSLLPGTVHFISGSPGSGKTAFVQQIIDYNAMLGRRVLVFSIEMVYDMLIMRKIQSYLGIPAWKMHTGHLTQDELERIVDFKNKLSDNVIYNDVSSIDIAKLKAIAKIENNKKKLDLIVIDYLQLIRVNSMKNKRKDEEIEFISAELLGLAKDLHIPIISVAQLNREWRNNEGRRPEMANLAGGSSLEKDASSITFVHRPAQFDKTYPKQDEAIFIVGKNRYGNSNDVKLKWIGENCKFVEYTPEELDDIQEVEFEAEKKVKKSLKLK